MLTKPQLVEFAIQQEKIPRNLYKYRVSDKKKNKHFDDILINGNLMFSSPLAFNDPFDCQLHPITEFTDEDINEYFESLLMKGNISNKVEKDILFESAITNKGIFSKVVEKAIKFDTKGVLCLSTEIDNLLLWAHYSDNHSGVCLNFDILKDPDFFVTPLIMEYSEDYPKYNHLKEPDTILQKMIRTKSLHWEYEKEIRILKQESGIYKFNKEALIEIIFGCKTSKEEIQRIVDLCKSNNLTHTKFKQAIKSKTHYKLEFEHLNY